MSARKADREFPIHDVMGLLAKACAAWREPIVTEQARSQRDPFRVLVATLISLRTKDEVTEAASARLFLLADTPEALLKLDEDTIARTIYPAGFYKTKAKQLRQIASRLLNDFDGETPSDLDTLLSLPGVGRKTANLVRTLGFGLPSICVDTHVHRITNRWGYVQTRSPEETEMALRAKLPSEYWIPINDLLVAYGQHLCTPTSPHCSLCTLKPHCAQNQVPRSR